MRGAGLQLPQGPDRPHYVKATVKVRDYPDATLAVFHGPCRLAGYDQNGTEIAAVPTCPSRDTVLATVKDAARRLRRWQSVIQAVQAHAARLSDTAALYQALGGGWWNRAAPLAQKKLDVSTGETTPVADEPHKGF
jgi:hypothetical protein